MTISNLQNLDLYKCSFQDINKAYKNLGGYVQRLINSGKASTPEYKEAKKLHVLIARARLGFDKDGYIIDYCTKADRLPNNESTL